ncbi:hypothetical protein THAOC_36509, partial [Thalassiosira oceanica]
MGQPIYQEAIEKSMRRSSIPTSIPFFELDDFDCDEVSVVTTETFGAGTTIWTEHLHCNKTKLRKLFPYPLLYSILVAEIVEATKKEFITRLKALTAARASGGKRVTKDECEELLYKIHAEQREKFDSTSVE